MGDLVEGTLDISGEKINYEIIRNPAIRNTYMRFEGEKLVLRSPSYLFMNRMLERHKTWIIKHYRQIKHEIRIFDRNSVSFAGRKYIAVFRQCSAGYGIEVTPECVIVSARDARHANILLERWLREKGEEKIRNATTEKAAALGVKLNGIRLRRTIRWGTCTSKGFITYNPYLAALPENVMDYVISHEVAHLRQMNHSKYFWGVVEKLHQDYKEARKQLRTYDNRYREVFAAD